MAGGHSHASPPCPPLLRPLSAGGTALAVPLSPQLSGLLTPVDAADMPRPKEQGGQDVLPAAGPWPGHASGPDLGGDFCFCFPLVLLRVDSIHLGLSGRFGERERYIIFFPLLLLFYFQEDDSLHGGREDQAGRGAEAG